MRESRPSARIIAPAAVSALRGCPRGWAGCRLRRRSPGWRRSAGRHRRADARPRGRSGSACGLRAPGLAGDLRRAARERRSARARGPCSAACPARAPEAPPAPVKEKAGLRPLFPRASASRYFEAGALCVLESIFELLEVLGELMLELLESEPELALGVELVLGALEPPAALESLALFLCFEVAPLLDWSFLCLRSPLCLPLSLCWPLSMLVRSSEVVAPVPAFVPVEALPAAEPLVVLLSVVLVLAPAPTFAPAL